MEDQKEFITVIITSYNRKKYLLDAIRSVLSCSLEKKYFEIILVKNYNDDEIDSFCRLNNIKNLQMDGSIGHFYSKAIESSKGNIISFLDDDDMWTDDKLAKVYDAFKNNNNLGYYHNKYVYINDVGEKINYRRVVEKRKDLIRSNSLFIEGRDKKNALIKLFKSSADFNMSCISIRKSILDNDYKFLENIYSFQDGAFFFISMLSNYDILIDDRVLTLYRINNDSVTYFNDEAKRVSELKKMEISMVAVKNYIEEHSNQEDVFLKEAIKCFIYEILIMIEVFSLNTRRRTVLKYLIHLIKIRKKNVNNLRNKIVAMAIISIFSKKLSVNIYYKYKKIIIAKKL